MTIKRKFAAFVAVALAFNLLVLVGCDTPNTQEGTHLESQTEQFEQMAEPESEIRELPSGGTQIGETMWYPLPDWPMSNQLAGWDINWTSTKEFSPNDYLITSQDDKLVVELPTDPQERAEALKFLTGVSADIASGDIQGADIEVAWYGKESGWLVEYHYDDAASDISADVFVAIKPPNQTWQDYPHATMADKTVEYTRGWSDKYPYIDDWKNDKGVSFLTRFTTESRPEKVSGTMPSNIGLYQPDASTSVYDEPEYGRVIFSLSRVSNPDSKVEILIYTKNVPDPFSLAERVAIQVYAS
jgi:hypothetical protein